MKKCQSRSKRRALTRTLGAIEIKNYLSIEILFSTAMLLLFKSSRISKPKTAGT
jgi:hypothetical protein